MFTDEYAWVCALDDLLGNAGVLVRVRGGACVGEWLCWRRHYQGRQLNTIDMNIGCLD